MVVCTFCQHEVPDSPYCRQCGAPLQVPSQNLVGKQVRQYLVLDRIAEGASGQVFHVRHIGTGEDFALKLLQPALSLDPKAIRRFRREAEIGMRLHHRHAVKLFEFGVAPEVGCFQVMELIQGHTLCEELYQGPLEPIRAIRIGLRICNVLTTAHSLGIIHRDLKPANIMLQHSNVVDDVKVCDFGTAKILQGHSKNETILTQPGTFCGTPGYMSPQHCQGATLDHRTDIYSLGVLLYELLTGHMPYDAKNPIEFMMMTLQQEPRPLLVAEPLLHSYPYAVRLSKLIHRCMAFAPEERFEDAEELRDALEECIPPTALTSSLLHPTLPKPHSFFDQRISFPKSQHALSAFTLQDCQNMMRQGPGLQLLPGQSLLLPEQESDKFYFLTQGEVVLLYPRDNDIVELARLGPDSFLGVSDFFTGSPVTIKAEAVRLSQVHCVDRTLLQDWCTFDDELAREFDALYHTCTQQRLLLTCTLFRGMTSEQQEGVLRHFQWTEVPAGAVVLEANQQPTALLLVAAGQLTLVDPWRADTTPQSEANAILLKLGHFLGHSALFEAPPLPYQVLAHTHTVLLRLPFSELKTLLRRYPHLQEILQEPTWELDFRPTTPELDGVY